MHNANVDGVNSAAKFTTDTTDYAVIIQNLYKHYDKGSLILRNFCMSVRKGTIYGLLGSSGCGKTTALSCLVGLENWNAGEIRVFGVKQGAPGNVQGKLLGYVPQNVAVIGYLTVWELIQFYGKLYRMSRYNLKQNCKVLETLLELPFYSTEIGNMSGGQQRRASLAVALIHSPKLLVLDEPTVGFDPLLRKKIWEYLQSLVTSYRATIIITTHYLEEARLANTIGLMRNGRLLVEESPSALLQKYDCDVLEKVILHLCKKDGNILEGTTNAEATGTGRDQSVKPDQESYPVNKPEAIEEYEVEIESDSKFYYWFERTCGLAAVLMLMATRYPISFIVLLLIPIFECVVTIVLLGAKPLNLPFGVVNNELANWSATCDLPIQLENNCELTALSCKYLNILKQDSTVILKGHDSEEIALEQVGLGNVWGYLKIPSNFTQHTLVLALSTRFASNETIEGSQIHIYLDNSQFVSRFFLEKSLYSSYFQYVASLFKSCNSSNALAEIPLKYKSPVYGLDNDNYSEYIIPGFYLSYLLMLTSLITALLIITDRKQGTFNRARVAGLTSWDLIAGHFFIQQIICLLQILVFGFVSRFAFSLQIAGSHLLCLLAIVIMQLCATAFGIFLGAVCQDELQVIIIELFLIATYLLYSGVLWPVESMSNFWQYFAYIVPTSPIAKSLRSVMIRGLGVSHELVWPGYLNIIGWTILTTVCSILAINSVK